MELVDMRDLGSRAAMRVGSSPFRRTKKKDMTVGHVFLFGFRSRWSLHPSVFQCSGQVNCPSAKVFASGENTCTAHQRRRPDGRLGGMNGLSFFLGFAPAGRFTLRYSNARGQMDQPHRPDSMGMICFFRDMILGRKAQFSSSLWMSKAWRMVFSSPT